MRTRLLTPLLCLLLVVLGGTLAIAHQPPAQQPGDDPMRGPRQPAGDPAQPARGPGRRGPGEGANIGGSMKTMNRDVRALRSMLDDPAKKEERYRTLGEMQRACIAAKTAPLPQPLLGKAKDDAERAALTAKYRANLIAVMRRMLDAEEHLAAGKNDLVRTDLEEILKLKEQGHKDMGLEGE